MVRGNCRKRTFASPERGIEGLFSKAVWGALQRPNLGVEEEISMKACKFGNRSLNPFPFHLFFCAISASKPASPTQFNEEQKNRNMDKFGYAIVVFFALIGAVFLFISNSRL